MALPERIALIKRIQELRSSYVFCYLTSVREGVPGAIASDQVRVFFEHLLLLPSKPVEKLDVFLVSNGGDSVVPWRLVSLLREYAKSFSVLIPYRAYSAASLLALGADEIVIIHSRRLAQLTRPLLTTSIRATTRRIVCSGSASKT